MAPVVNVPRSSGDRGTVFVSIASYRDPELVPTLLSLLETADDPELLRIVVCDQFGPEAPELPDGLKNDSRILRIPVPWEQSRGACWARARIMQEYRGEAFYLQLDSHHRFVPGWDTILKADLASTGRSRAMLTGYVNDYRPDMPLNPDPQTLELHFDAFHADGIAVFRPVHVPARAAENRPTRARFVSGHFIFAHGAFVSEVPYDPELYFIGEEISLSVRAFMKGWYLYHPSQPVAFHEYTREYRPNKHWNDHTAVAVETPWYELDARSRKSVVTLLNDHGGEATVRTLRDYEDYAGLCFSTHRVHPDTLAFTEPPVRPRSDWRTAGFRYVFQLPFPMRTVDHDCAVSFWLLEVADDAGAVIYRREIFQDDLRRMAVRDGTICVPVSFDSESPPDCWSAQPAGSDTEPTIGGILVVAATEPPIVWVTGLLDLGRDALPEPRAFAEYRSRLSELLGALPEFDRVVVFCDEADEAWVRDARGAGLLEIRGWSIDMLRQRPEWPSIEAIRCTDAWKEQSPWLATSPQAALPGYAALVLQKLPLLASVAADLAPDSRIFWVDAGITRTVHPSAVNGLATRCTDDALRLFAYPYPEDAPEIHGFARVGLRQFSPEPVTLVPRGGVFGGFASVVGSALPVYEALLHRTLDAGFLGTEESLFSILHARREPGFQHVVEIPDSGLIPSEPAGRSAVLLSPPTSPDRVSLMETIHLIGQLSRGAAPAHVGLRGPDSRAQLALIAPWLKQGDWLTVYEGDEHRGGSNGLAFIQQADVERATATLLATRRSGAITYQQNGKSRATPDLNAEATAAVYVLTYNAPDQFQEWLTRALAVCPQLLHQSVDRVLVNNSTDAGTEHRYNELCELSGFRQIRRSNVGITGGRIVASQDFLDTACAGQMWYFEDDMLLDDGEGLCRSGFTRQVRQLFETVTRIMCNEPGLDLLKLSFTEFFGDHQLNWAWVNSSPRARETEFPTGSATEFRSIRSTDGVPWALGGVHYSHWPSVLTRRGAQLLFGGQVPPRTEQAAMLLAHELQQTGQLGAAVLLASPIAHGRSHDYARADRREYHPGSRVDLPPSDSRHVLPDASVAAKLLVPGIDGMG